MSSRKISTLSNRISNSLQSSARSFYKLGMETFFESRSGSRNNFQPAIANLAIGVELLLKSIIARKCLGLLYSGLSQNDKLLLFYPASVHSWARFQSLSNDLYTSSIKTIELNECVSLFLIIVPSAKREYKQFLENLSSIRNSAVHSTVPSFHRYETERLACYATRLFTFAQDNRIIDHFYFEKHSMSDQFIKEYEEEKILKVKSSLDKAKAVVKKGLSENMLISTDDWSQMETTCPICGSDGICEGETEVFHGEEDLHLEFFRDNFKCSACGLILEDAEEIQMAGLDVSTDRDDDIDRWYAEFSRDRDDYC